MSAKRRLRISHPADVQEVEADRIADRVMTSGGPVTDVVGSGSAMDVRHEAGSRTAPPSHGTLPFHMGPGQQLEEGVATPMGFRFGADFSGVRVHTGAQASAVASAMGARAFSSGQNIVFGAGQYQPGSPAGQRLVAHELAHVLQPDPEGRILRKTADQVNFRQIFAERKNEDASSAHAMTLVQAFKDPRISGTSVTDRFLSILDLTGGRTPGPTAHFDSYTIREIGTESSAAGVGDTGFRVELRDSLVDQGRAVDNHRESSDQIGHFLTAAHIGYYVTSGDNYLNKRAKEIAAYKSTHPIRSLFSVEESVNEEQRMNFNFDSNLYLSAMIGHEMIADRSISGWGITSTALSPFMATSQDYSNFANDRLDLIKIDDTKKGNSYQDILLTWLGFRFGQNVANGRYSSNEEASRWLNLMLTPQDLNAVAKTDPFYAEAQELIGLLRQVQGQIDKGRSPQKK